MQFSCLVFCVRLCSLTASQFAAITRQLFESYNTTVSNTGSVDELCRASLVWVNQSCTLPQLRRGMTGCHCTVCRRVLQVLVFMVASAVLSAVS